MPNKPIPEAASEKPKRGRPRVISEELEQKLVGITLPRDVSRRQRLNHYHAFRSLGVLGNECKSRAVEFPDRYEWLCNNRNGAEQVFRMTILSELGRIEDDDLVVELATQLCETRPKTRQAVARIREIRDVRRKTADALDLANEMIGVVNDYLARFPDTTEEQVSDALRTAGSQCSKSR